MNYYARLLRWGEVREVEDLLRQRGASAVATAHWLLRINPHTFREKRPDWSNLSIPSSRATEPPWIVWVTPTATKTKTGISTANSHLHPITVDLPFPITTNPNSQHPFQTCLFDCKTWFSIVSFTSEEMPSTVLLFPSKSSTNVFYSFTAKQSI